MDQTHANFYAAAEAALTELHEDATVPFETTLASLCSLRAELATLIAATERDLQTTPRPPKRDTLL
jgi:hypothetical protein